MSFQFIIGDVGTGKSTHAYNLILKDAREFSKRSHFLLVPEQATLQTQKALCNAHPNKSIMDVDILSFERLAFRVFKELGINTLNVLEETGKSLIIRKLLVDLKDELSVIGKRPVNIGYVDEIKSMISELSQYRVSPDMLEELLSKDNMPEGKLSDLAKIYRGFLNTIEGEYVTGEILLELLCNHINESDLLEDAVIVFDGYTGFTPIQEAIIEKLMSKCHKLIFTVTLDAGQASFSDIHEDELFYMGKNMIRRLRKIAIACEVAEEDYILCTEGVNNALKNRDISVHVLENPRKEVIFVASKIKEMIMQGYRMCDIAIVCADQSLYESNITEIFNEYDIPVFIDKKQTLSDHPAVAYIRNTFNCINANFSPRSVMAYLRSAYMLVDRHEGDLFENYILATGIRGKKAFLSSLYLMPNNISEEELTDLEKIRGKMAVPFDEFYKLFPNKKTEYPVRKLLEYTYSLINCREDDVYEMIVSILEKINALIGNDTMSVEDFPKVLLTALESGKLGKLPQNADMVMFSDVTRSRMGNIKSLFIIGANEGILPDISTGSNYFSQKERRLLKERDINLAPDKIQRVFESEYYLHLIMSKPSTHLYISYASLSAAGEIIRPSYVVNNLIDRFPDTNIVFGDHSIYNINEARERLGILLSIHMRNSGLTNKENEELKSLYAYFLQHEPNLLNEYIINILRCNKTDSLSEKVLRSLDSEVISGSVSRLESYAKCAYSYFLNYVLRIRERQLREFNVMDMGNIYHEGLKYYFLLAKKDKVDVRDISDDKQRDLVNRAVELVYESLESKASYDSGADTYIKRRVGITLNKTVWALSEQIKAGDFLPERFEVDIREINDGKKLLYELESGCKLDMSGIIDRLDTTGDKDVLYLKIIDYKSGNKKIDYGDLYSGLQIQLLYYMDEAKLALEKKNKGQRIVPSAVLYYHIDDPLVESDNKLLKEMRPNGIISDDVDSIIKLDKGFMEAFNEGDGYNSDAIRVDLKKPSKEGHFFTEKSQLVSKDNLNRLLEFAKEKAMSLANDISTGSFDVIPYRKENKSACDYCSYHGICGFDKEEGRYRDIPKIQDVDKLIEMIGGDKSEV